MRSCSYVLPVSLSADYALLTSEGTTNLHLVLGAVAEAAIAAVALQICVPMMTVVHASQV